MVVTPAVLPAPSSSPKVMLLASVSPPR
jgi:hypothetical protein